MRTETLEPQSGAGPVSGKPREAAALLVCLGLALLFPPIVLIFAKPHHMLGIPLPVFYIFGIWLVLVLGAVAVSRLLPDPESSD